MVFSQEFFKSLQEFAEMQRDLERTLAATQVQNLQIDPSVIEATQRYAEQQQEIESMFEKTAVFQAQGLLESMPLQEMAAAQQSLVQPSVVEAAVQSAQIHENIATELATNQAFIEAVEQSATIADSVEELQRMALVSQYQHRPAFERKVYKSDIQPTNRIYEQTIDPYEPVREEVYATQHLIAGYIIASATDQGELSDELSETEKKHIRLGLAVVVGFAAGLPAGFVFGPAIGVGTVISAGAWTSRELDGYYDIKQRQQLPEEDSESCEE